ncbi:hypothetical protein GRB70_39355 [Bradyrhizobium neotropicale]|nr:hypothetical protein [Bradyrhizobium neotropicale]
MSRKRRRKLPGAVTPPARSLLPPPVRATPPFSWPPKRYDILALLITACLAAVLWPYRHFIFLGCAIYFLGRGWFWLCRRHPMAAWFILGFVRGLFRR